MFVPARASQNGFNYFPVAVPFPFVTDDKSGGVIVIGSGGILSTVPFVTLFDFEIPDLTSGHWKSVVRHAEKLMDAS